MSFQEKDFQVLFNRWCKYNIIQTSVFELKITKGNSLPFTAVKEHQENALYIAKHSKAIYKLPDDSAGQKPFDSFTIVNATAFIVIMFRAKQKEFVMIDIDKWLEEKKLSLTEGQRKSITYDRAREIGSVQSLV